MRKGSSGLLEEGKGGSQALKSIDQRMNKRDYHWDKYSKRSIIKGDVEIKDKKNMGDDVWIYREPKKDKFSPIWYYGLKLTNVVSSDA